MLLEVKINHNNVYYKTDIDILLIKVHWFFKIELLIKVHYVVAVSINQMWGHPRSYSVLSVIVVSQCVSRVKKKKVNGKRKSQTLGHCLV